MSDCEKVKCFMDYIMGDNQEFYDTFLLNLSEEEFESFMENNPDFMESIEGKSNDRE